MINEGRKNVNDIIEESIPITNNQKLIVDLESDTGTLRYGATGFLYGMSNEGIPSDTMLAALKPQVLAQKAPDGIQHPGGDALKVAPQFLRNGGKEVEIYMQDFYASWPYPYNIADYLLVAADIARKVTLDPNRNKFVYVPLNEPDSNGYNKTDKLQLIFDDWHALYDVIRETDPMARIAGPGFAVYDSACYGQFLTFCQNNNCLPDQIVWHELEDSFYTNWYSNVSDYRALETSRGISSIPIVINEYVKNEENLSIPGILVQQITRLENSKVDGCLAYWCKSGGLNDLVTWSDNMATGGWWVFKWYGEMTGHTVTVIPPNANAQGLSGLASLDYAKKQVRVIFGGSSGSTDIIVTGLTSTTFYGSSVHVTVWGVDNSDKNVSNGPYLEEEGNYTIKDGSITVILERLVANSAYHMIITPDTCQFGATSNRYEAEYASLSGTAKIAYGGISGYSGTGYVEGYVGSKYALANFVINNEADGYYNISLRYSAGPLKDATDNRTILMLVNGSKLKDLLCAGTEDWGTWEKVNTAVFLQAGINRIGFETATYDNNSAINIDCIDVTPATGIIVGYEAEASNNTLGGMTFIASDTAASGGQYVAGIGGGEANYLQFNDVYVQEAGAFKMIVQFANNERGSGAGGSDIVDRYADISVNGGAPKGYYFRYTDSWSDFRTKVINVVLKEGNNTIRFSNNRGYVELAKVAAIPQEGKWSQLEVHNSNSFRYLRYLGPYGGYCNISEMEFYNSEGEKLTGTAFGTTPAFSVGTEYDKAYDGDITTAFEYAGAKCGYTGIDLGEGNAQRVALIKYYPKAGYEDRMVGGKFQGSNDNLYESCWAPNIDKISIAERESGLQIG